MVAETVEAPAGGVTVAIGVPLQLPAKNSTVPLIFTAAGKFAFNVTLFPAQTLFALKVNELGASFHLFCINIGAEIADAHPLFVTTTRILSASPLLVPTCLGKQQVPEVAEPVPVFTHAFHTPLLLPHWKVTVPIPLAEIGVTKFPLCSQN